MELHHVRRGEGEPLLLVQGMSGTHLSWGEPFLSALERDFALVAYDHRGIGESGRLDGDFTIADLADDAARLLDRLGLGAAHVLGVSMGGMVAQELALRHPARVRTLTLGCTYSGGSGSALTDPAIFQRLTASWQSGDRERILRAAWEINVSAGFAGNDEAWTAFRDAALALPVPITVVMAQLRAISGHDTSERLREIAAPTLVIHGTEDRMLDVANGRRIAERIPSAGLEELEGVGHLFWIEQPERSAALVREHARAASPA